MTDFNKSIHMDDGDFKEFVNSATDLIVSYLDKINQRPISGSAHPNHLLETLPDSAPIHAEHWTEILKDVERLIIPSLTHWQSPRFHGYYPTGHSYPSIVAGLLCDGLGALSLNWISNPASTELEVVVVNWLGSMIGLPQEFLFSHEHNGGGSILASGSESTFMALLGAKTKKIATLKARDSSLDDSIISTKFVGYCSSQAHSSAGLSGILSGLKIRILETDEHSALRAETLEEAIKQDIENGLIPFFVLATLGTTRTCAFDPIDEIGTIVRKYDVWLHIDASYAGTAFVCPEYRHFMRGIELADSFICSPHKWLLTNNGCSVIWYQNSEWIVKTLSLYKQAINEDSDNLGMIPEFHHWQISTARPFRSLRLWFVLRLYGIEHLQEHIRRGCTLAKQFETLCRADNRFEIIGNVDLGLVCFRLKGSNELNQLLLQKILDRRNIFLLFGELKGVIFLRLAIGSKLTAPPDIQYSWNEISEVASEIRT